MEDLILASSTKHGIEPRLLKAIIKTESGGNPLAIRYEEDYRWVYKVDECAKLVGCTIGTAMVLQKTSWGLMQLMGAIYYELGGRNWATILLNPEYNLDYGCRYLKGKIFAQGLVRPEEIYASFNAGSVRRVGSLFVNQKNVDRFMKHYLTLDA